MNEFMTTISHWHWLVLGFAFLALEALGAGGFVLGAALGSVLVAIILWIVPGLAWTWQLVWFGLSSLVFTIGYWKLFRRVNEKTDNKLLNNRAARLVGRVIHVSEPITDGQGKVQIGDTLWSVKTTGEIKAEEKARVVGAEGMVLLIEPYTTDK